MIQSRADVIGVCETWLKEDEYVEVSDKMAWVGLNRGFESSGGGGVGFCINKESNLVYQKVTKDGVNDVLLIRSKRKANKKWEFLIGVVYFEVEGRQGGWEKNVLKAAFLQEQVEKAKQEGITVYIGGDLNGHIYELDGNENRNGEIIRALALNSNLEILNCVIEGMDTPTWERGDSKYRLDYCLACEKGMENVQRGEVMEMGEGVGVDHAGLKLKIAIKDMERAKRGRGKETTKKKVLRKADWEVFGSKVEEGVQSSERLEDAIRTTVNQMSSGNSKRERDSMKWVDEEVLQKIDCRRKASRNHRRVKKKYGEGSEEQKMAWEEYEFAKEQAHATTIAKMRKHDVRVMQEIKQGENRARDLWKHVRDKLDKGKRQSPNEGNLLFGPDGEEITREEELKAEITRVWADLFCNESKAIMGIEKEKVLEGLDELKEVEEEELQLVINKLKNGKAVGEDDIAGEYLKALKTVSRQQLKNEINSLQGWASTTKLEKKQGVTHSQRTR